MKRLTVFEMSIIGFFVGVVISTYVIYLESTGAYISSVLNYISLKPLFELIPKYSSSIFFEFIFIVIVYTFYACIASLLIKKINRSIYFISLIIVIFLGLIIYQQSTGVSEPQSDLIGSVYSSIPVSHQNIPESAPKKTNEQYFGNEVVGDLNGDGISDVAFVISRIDPDRGTLYYLTCALTTENGHTGTNLLFLGNKIDPQVISITNGIIDISYIDRSDKLSTSTKDFLAQVKEGKLEQMSQK